MHRCFWPVRRILGPNLRQNGCMRTRSDNTVGLDYRWVDSFIRTDMFGRVLFVWVGPLKMP
jgi:hypothetical protein